MNANENPRAPRCDAGFTLIEIMVVIVILGLLATMVATNVMGKSDQAKIETARTSIKTIESAVESYYITVGKFPTSLEDLTSEDVKGGPYLKSLEKDPWGNDFQFRGENKKDFEVLSYGPDGSEGTEDDISSRKKE
ncbi:MAG: type II secretion system major pseudopilin GspG [Planctomycetota bacterium]